MGGAITAPVFSCCIPTYYHPSFPEAGTPKLKIILPRAESGTALALILIQRIICHLIARIYVQLAPLAAHEDMQK
jgi:hypothetical protein